MRLVVLVVPRLYMAYMRLVELTTRQAGDPKTALFVAAAARHDRCVVVLWHQEVFSVAYDYRHLGAHTLASVSDFGDIIAEMLRLCKHTVMRGGSGSKSRQRHVLPTLIEHMLAHERVVYGLTVDGSRGPVHVVKPGAALLARACRAPIICVRSRYRWGITLPTWDRAQIPLPFFNRRVTLSTGPYWIAPDADDDALEAFRRHLQNELLELTERVYAELGAERLRRRRWGFPPGWQPRWAPGQLGQPHRPHDLDLEHPPPWAHRPGGTPAAR
jgi:hypothetical protein